MNDQFSRHECRIATEPDVSNEEIGGKTTKPW
jgi:hypothetical protein